MSQGSGNGLFADLDKVLGPTQPEAKPSAPIAPVRKGQDFFSALDSVIGPQQPNDEANTALAPQGISVAPVPRPDAGMSGVDVVTGSSTKGQPWEINSTAETAAKKQQVRSNIKADKTPLPGSFEGKPGNVTGFYDTAREGGETLFSYLDALDKSTDTKDSVFISNDVDQIAGKAMSILGNILADNVGGVAEDIKTPREKFTAGKFLAGAEHNVIAPAGKAGAQQLQGLIEPQNIVTLGTMGALEGVTAPLAQYALRAANAYFTAEMTVGAGKGAYQSFRQLIAGNLPGAVESGLNAVFSGLMAKDTAHGMEMNDAAMAAQQKALGDLGWNPTEIRQLQWLGVDRDFLDRGITPQDKPAAGDASNLAKAYGKLGQRMTIINHQLLDGYAQATFGKGYDALSTTERAQMMYDVSKESPSPERSALLDQAKFLQPPADTDATSKILTDASRELEAKSAVERENVNKWSDAVLQANDTIANAPEKVERENSFEPVPVLDAQVPSATERMFLRQQEAEKEAWGAINQEREYAAQQKESESKAAAEQQRIAADQPQEGGLKIVDRRTVTPEQAGVDTMGSQFYGNEQELASIASQHQFVDANEMLRSLQDTKLSGRALEPWQQRALQLGDQRESLRQAETGQGQTQEAIAPPLAAETVDDRAASAPVNEHIEKQLAELAAEEQEVRRQRAALSERDPQKPALKGRLTEIKRERAALQDEIERLSGMKAIPKVDGGLETAAATAETAGDRTEQTGITQPPAPVQPETPAQPVVPAQPKVPVQVLNSNKATREAKLRKAADTLATIAQRDSIPPAQKVEAQRQSAEAKTMADNLQAQRREELVAALAQQAAVKGEYPVGDAIPVSLGNEADVIFPGGKKYRVAYGIAKLSDLKFSHDPYTWEWNDNYEIRPAQPRDYATHLGKQLDVQKIGASPDTRILHSDDPSTNNGPPVVRADGQAIVNGRLMGQTRAYKEGNAGDLHADLLRAAMRFGIPTDQIPSIHDHPVLVRVLLEPVTKGEDLVRLGVVSNEKSGFGYGEAENAVRLASLMNQNDMDWIVSELESHPDKLDSKGEIDEKGWSIRDLLNKRNDYVARLMRDSGMIPVNDADRFIDSDGNLTKAAKDDFEAALFGRIIDDASLIKRTPQAILNKLDRSLAVLARIKARTDDWNISDYLKEALEFHYVLETASPEINASRSRIKKHYADSGKEVPKASDIDLYLNSGDYEAANRQLIDVRTRPHPVAEALARLLERPSAEVKERLDDFISHAPKVDEREQEGFGFYEAPSALKEFKREIGKPMGVVVPDGDWGTLKAQEQKPVVESPQETKPVVESETAPGLTEQPRGLNAKTWGSATKAQTSAWLTAAGKSKKYATEPWGRLPEDVRAALTGPITEPPAAEPAAQEAPSVTTDRHGVKTTTGVISDTRAAELRAHAVPKLDTKGQPTGWKWIETQRGTILVHPTENKAIAFEAVDDHSGTQKALAHMEAIAYAMDNRIESKPVDVSKMGELVSKPIFEKSSENSTPREVSPEIAKAAADTYIGKDLARTGQLKGVVEVDGQKYIAGSEKDGVRKLIRVFSPEEWGNKPFYSLEQKNEALRNKKQTDLYEGLQVSLDGQRYILGGRGDRISIKADNKAAEATNKLTEPPSDASVLPGMEGAVGEQSKAAEKFKTDQQLDEMNHALTTPQGSVSKAAGEMERNSPLFGGTEASGNGLLFGADGKPIQSSIAEPPKASSPKVEKAAKAIADIPSDEMSTNLFHAKIEKRLGTDVANVAVALAKGHADYLGMSLDEYLKQHLSRVETEGQPGEAAYNQAAYHGSPYKFDKFSLEHMGKGEGAQAYGWGLYFAGNKEVSDWYRQKLSESPEHRTVLLDGEPISRENNWSLWNAIDNIRPGETLESEIASLRNHANFARKLYGDATASMYENKADVLEKYKDRITFGKGQLYEADIPESDTMLHWDKPLSEQPEKVREALAKAGFEITPNKYPSLKQAEHLFESTLVQSLAAEDIGIRGSLRDGYKLVKAGDAEGFKQWFAQHGGLLSPGRLNDTTGEQAYNSIASRLGKERTFGSGDLAWTGKPKNDEAASKYLNSLGISGIKYLDGSSRGKGDGNYNYVVFDDKAIKVLNTFYQAGAFKSDTRGAVEFVDDAKAVLYLLEKANASTIIHEMGHIFRRTMKPEDLAITESEFKVENGAWDKKSEEKFARTFERYFWEGKSPNEKLRGVFDQIKGWMRSIYEKLSSIPGAIKIGPAGKRVFDRIIGGEVGEPPSVGEKTDSAPPSDSRIILEQADHLNPQQLRQQINAVSDRLGKIIPQEERVQLGRRLRELEDQLKNQSETALPEKQRIIMPPGDSFSEPPTTETTNGNQRSTVAPQGEQKGSSQGAGAEQEGLARSAVAANGRSNAQPDADSGRLLEASIPRDATATARTGNAQKAVAITEPPSAKAPRVVLRPSSMSMQELTEVIRQNIPKGGTVESRIDAATKHIEGADKGDFSDRVGRAKMVMASLYDAYKRPPDAGDYMTAIRKWSGADNRAALELHRFIDDIKEATNSPLEREGMTNWLEADGDEGVLRARAAASDEKYRPGYEAALNLTEKQKNIVRAIAELGNSTGLEGQRLGMLGDVWENYLQHIYSDDPQQARRVMGEANFSSLKMDPSFTKKRTLPTYFDAETIGMTPKNKDIAFLVSIHEQSFRQAIAARAFVRTLLTGKAEDGRPLVAIDWEGAKEIPDADNPQEELIKANTKPGEDGYGDYRIIDSPSLRGYKFAMKEGDNPPITMRGNLLVHPDIFRHLKNNLTRSAIRDYEMKIGNLAFKPGDAALKVGSEVKSMILSFSGFHQTTLGVHAMEHRVNPFMIPEIDLKVPEQARLIDSGLVVADYHAQEAFGEGLVSSDWLTHAAPLAGAAYRRYSSYLFQDYLPRLKMSLAQHMLERNMERYQGKLSDQQIYNLSADQANAALGGLNYRVLGRNKTLQDVLRLTAMAPDFLEARLRFAGQALKPYGREQSSALVFGAAVLYSVARILNQALDDDPHWDKPFAVVYHGKEFSLRTLQEDMFRAVSEPGKFAMNRLSPYASGAIGFLTGKNKFGKQTDLVDRAKQAARSNVPIPLQPWLQDNHETPAERALESVLKMVGINVRSATDHTGGKSGHVAVDAYGVPLDRSYGNFEMTEPPRAH